MPSIDLISFSHFNRAKWNASFSELVSFLGSMNSIFDYTNYYLRFLCDLFVISDFKLGWEVDPNHIRRIEKFNRLKTEPFSIKWRSRDRRLVQVLKPVRVLPPDRILLFRTPFQIQIKPLSLIQHSKARMDHSKPSAFAIIEKIIQISFNLF